MTAEQLEQALIQLGPWHHEIQVTEDVSTGVTRDAEYAAAYGPVSFLDMRQAYKTKLLRLFPQGLEGRSVLDCGCNCGESLFWAKEIGAGECFGFDAREHWIKQGRFLLEHRTVGPTEGSRLEVADLYALPDLRLDQFDVVLFHGLFYHLPDPVMGLRIAADHTRELLVLDTSTRSRLPDGLLALQSERNEVLLHGVHGVSWLPTGPRVLETLLTWLGFRDTKLLWWQHEVDESSEMGRLELLAAKAAGLLS